MKLKAEVHSLSVTNRALMLGRMPKQSSRYFMEGATMLIMKENSSTDAVVCVGLLWFSFAEFCPWIFQYHL